ncbi:MAG: PTS sugar transporter subunit IIB [Clostridiales bacterium]|nr:PTS sugar transporter subunit IIB [Clostridiales bacterium]
MMKLLRVDHRLLHGQVAFSWTNTLGTDCILIANDSVPTDDIRKTTLKLSKPNGVKLVIKTVNDSIVAINSGVTDKYRLFVITESIHDARRLVEGCPSVREVNLGGTKKTADKRPISKFIFVTEEDVEDIHAMLRTGAEVELRQPPADNKITPQDVI